MAWSCGRCGFNNKPMNEICGGKGPLGCNAPRPDGFGPEQGGSSGWGPMSGRSTSRISPYAGGQGGDTWQCSCGFKNRPCNRICGGDGPMGCKTPKDVGSADNGDNMVMAQMIRMMTGDKGGGKGTEWTCPICSFKNRPMNSVCGGTGSMGCKNPRPTDGQDEGIEAMMKQMLGGALPWMMPAGPESGKGKGKGGQWTGGPQWKCEGCGFTNRSSNDVCGGTGPMGCKSPKTDGAATQAFDGRKTSSGEPDWLCSCGFVNRAQNTVCGGKGPMGCKTEKAACAVEGS